MAAKKTVTKSKPSTKAKSAAKSTAKKATGRKGCGPCKSTKIRTSAGKGKK